MLKLVIVATASLLFFIQARNIYQGFLICNGIYRRNFLSGKPHFQM